MTESRALLKRSSRIKPAPCDDEFPHLKGKVGEMTMENKLLCEKTIVRRAAPLWSGPR